MNKLLISLCLVALALTASAQWASSGPTPVQQPQQPPQMWTQPSIATNASQIAVQGQSWLVVAPEIVGMTVGFWNWNTSAADALNANTMTVNQTVTALMNLGVSADNITTSFFTIEPYYGQQNMSGTPMMSQQQLGYAVWNELSVVTMMLGEASQLIAAIAAVPGASIQSISWDVSDATRMMIRSQLQGQALSDAKMQAQDAVMSVGNTLGSIASVNLVQPVNVEPKWVPSSVRTSMSTLMMNNGTMMNQSMMNQSMMNQSMMNQSMMNQSMMNNNSIMNNDSMMMNNNSMMQNGTMMMQNGSMMMPNGTMTMPDGTMLMSNQTMMGSSMMNMTSNMSSNTSGMNMASPIFSGSLWYWASAFVVFNYNGSA